MRRSILSILLATGLLGSVTGCGEDRPTAADLMTAGDAFSLYEPGAEMTGKLAVDEQGCVTLATDEGTALFVASNGSTLEEDGKAVALQGHGTYELGNDITVAERVTRWERGNPRPNRPNGWESCVEQNELTPLLAFVHPN